MTDAPPKAWLKGLRWIAKHEPVGWIDVTGPALFIVRRLDEAKLIETCGREPGMFGVTRYRLTDAGRAVLAQNPEVKA